MFHRVLLAAALAASLPASAIELADLNPIVVTGQTAIPTLPNAIKGRSTDNALCLARGVGAGAGYGTVGTFQVVNGQLACASYATFTRQPTVYWADTSKFLWRPHTGASVTSSAVRFGKNVSGADVIPCRQRGGGHVGTVGTFGGALKCQAGPRAGNGTVPTHVEFDVLIRKSWDRA